MRTPEKNDNPTIVEKVKDRLFDRHNFQHEFWRDHVLKEHPKYFLTPLECHGIAARLANFDEDRGFIDTCFRLKLISKVIKAWMVIEKDRMLRDQLSTYLDDLQELIELFNWLHIYGPFEE